MWRFRSAITWPSSPAAASRSERPEARCRAPRLGTPRRRDGVRQAEVRHGVRGGAVSLDFSALWPRAQTYDQFVAQSHMHCALWTGVYRLARVPAWALERACAGGQPYRLLALAEDWCGDASSICGEARRPGALPR